MRYLYLLFLFLSFESFGMPKKLEVWFLSPPKTAFLDKILDHVKFSKSIAQGRLQCQQMGEYCFDPQVGLYKPNDQGVGEVEIDYSQAEELETYKELPHARSIDREMIDCDGADLFDFFCHRAKKEQQTSGKLEVWIDTSSTLKEIDPDKSDDICMRQSFVTSLDVDCPLNKKMKLYVFTESLKKIDTFSRVCSHYGLNNIDRLIKKINESNSQNLLIITDIYEANEKLLNFIDNAGGSHRGVKELMYAKDMKTYLKDIVALCK